MKAGMEVLAVWLSPVAWLSMATLVAQRGPDGLWIGLAMMIAPLMALGLGTPRDAAVERQSVVFVAALFLAVAILFCANLTLAGDVATWLGVPRWRGIVLAAGAGFLVTAWRGAVRLVPVLLAVAVVAACLPLLELARRADAGPLNAWAKVAALPAFRFPATSPWVTRGFPLENIGARDPIRFDEEHRVTVPSGGRLAARSSDGARPDGKEWMVAAGQSVVFRPGDRLLAAPDVRVQFEPDKRVPGAPVSGVAWASGQPPDWGRSAGLLVTLLCAAGALCRPAAARPASRSAVVVVAAGGLAVFLWTQAWAIYSLLLSPDVLLGAVTPDRLLVAVTLREDPLRDLLQSLPLIGGLASFLASSIVLRERLGDLDATGGGEIGRDLGVWAGVFAIAGLAAVWRLDAWSLALLGLGVAGSTLGAVRLGSAATGPVAAGVAGTVGLAVFSGIAVMGHMWPGTRGVLGAVLAYPALAAVPAAVLARGLCRAVSSR
jgi:hypothetical protein